jgi:hypothetical protein
MATAKDRCLVAGALLLLLLAAAAAGYAHTALAPLGRRAPHAIAADVVASGPDNTIWGLWTLRR